MFFIAANLVVFASATFAFWWLSSFDVKVTGENPREDFIRRGVRCGLTLFLVEVAFCALWQYWRYGDRAAGMLYLACTIPLAIIWAGCVSELVARGVHWLIDPPDHRPFDPNHGTRELDVIADWIRKGRKDEAIRLCQMLIKTGDFNTPVLAMTLEYLGVPQERARLIKPLTEAHRLRQEGRFEEAELILTSLVAANPRDVEAAMMLMRLFAQDRRRPDKALEVLRELEAQPHLSSAYFEFARRSIAEWSQPRSATTAAEPPPETVDELLAQKYIGTAIEILGQKIGEQPRDFELRLKLAEVYALHCADFHRAGKVVHEMQTRGCFSVEQIHRAQAKLREWHEIRLNRPPAAGPPSRPEQKGPS